MNPPKEKEFKRKAEQILKKEFEKLKQRISENNDARSRLR